MLKEKIQNDDPSDKGGERGGTQNRYINKGWWLTTVARFTPSSFFPPHGASRMIKERRLPPYAITASGCSDAAVCRTLARRNAVERTNPRSLPYRRCCRPSPRGAHMRFSLSPASPIAVRGAPCKPERERGRGLVAVSKIARRSVHVQKRAQLSSRAADWLGSEKGDGGAPVSFRFVPLYILYLHAHRFARLAP